MTTLQPAGEREQAGLPPPVRARQVPVQPGSVRLRLTDARELTWKPLDNRKDGCFTSVGDTRYEVSSVDDDGVSPSF